MDIANKDVAVVFDAYADDIWPALLLLRRLILQTATETDGVGVLEETLRWGQPSYLTTKSKSGSMIRIDRVKSAPGQYALYVHYQTSLIEMFKERYPHALRYDGNRAILFDVSDEPPEEALRHCIAMALTYRLRKRPGFANNVEPS